MKYPGVYTARITKSEFWRDYANLHNTEAFPSHGRY